jgi:hypothetical protein
MESINLQFFDLFHLLFLTLWRQGSFVKLSFSLK